VVPEQAEVQFGARFVRLTAAESREWLVTNGIGGYASGTVAGSQTRRYHGLLVAALQRPWAARSLSRPSTRSSTTLERISVSPHIAGPAAL